MFNGVRQDIIVFLTLVESLTISVQTFFLLFHLLDIVSPSHYVSCIFYIRDIFSAGPFCLLIYIVHFMVSSSCSSSNTRRVIHVVNVATFGINRFSLHQSWTRPFSILILQDHFLFLNFISNLRNTNSTNQSPYAQRRPFKQNSIKNQI